MADARRKTTVRRNRIFSEPSIWIPFFARAYSALALTYVRDVTDGWADIESLSMAKADELARRALELDGSAPEVRFVLSQLELYRTNYFNAIKQIEQAISLKPSYADGYAMLAWTLHSPGRPAEGLDAMERATGPGSHPPLGCSTYRT